MANVVHHIELWTSDLGVSAAPFDWLLTTLGWQPGDDDQWPQGRTWHHPSDVYLVLEQSPAVSGPHDRMHAGLNHVALRARSRRELDAIRAACGAHGWHELFPDRYPHAGGTQHVALHITNDEGFEIELVAEQE